MTKCIWCGSKLGKKATPVSTTLRGLSIQVEAAGLVCSGCGEVFMDIPMMTALQNKVRSEVAMLGGSNHTKPGGADNDHNES